MSNILFANQDRLKTIGRFLAYDKVVSINQHDFELEEEIVFRGKRYKIKAKLTKCRKSQINESNSPTESGEAGRRSDYSPPSLEDVKGQEQETKNEA